jgi:uncharacterized protein (TIGR03086 family)
MTIDMHTGANRLASLVWAAPGDALSHPTPCSEYTVGDLLDHVSGFAVGIAAAGRKDAGGMKPPSPGRAANLGEGWRTRIPAELVALAEAWDDPAAYEGMTGGPLDMPGEMAATVGVEELCIHAWDLASALGEPFEATSTELDIIDKFFSRFGPDLRGSAYKPPVTSSATDRLARAIAVSGRDPHWRP